MSTRRRMIDRDEARAVAPRRQPTNTAPRPAATSTRPATGNPLLGLLRGVTNVANAFIQRTTGGQGAIAAIARGVTGIVNRVTTRQTNTNTPDANANTPQGTTPAIVRGEPEEIWDVRNRTNGQQTNLRRDVGSVGTTYLRPVGQGLHLLVEPDAVQIRNMLRNTPWLIDAALKLQRTPLDGFAFLLSRSLALTNAELLVLLNTQNTFLQQPANDESPNDESSLNDSQIYNIYLAASEYLQGDLASDTGPSPYDYISWGIPIPLEMRSQILVGHLA